MAVMAQARYKGRVVGYSVTAFYKNSAYNLYSAKEDDFVLCPINHVMYWEIMKNLKKRGILHYEVGVQQFGPLIYDHPTEKLISISDFMRGFGGVVIPRFMGEKFYSKEYCKETWQNRTQKYLHIMNETNEEKRYHEV